MRIAFLSLILSSAVYAGCDVYYLLQINKAHFAITDELFHGQVTWAKPFGGHGNQHEVLKVTVRDPRTGKERPAVFKPRPWGDSDGWARVTGEFVAYHVNRKLGMDYIAPVAYRRWMNFNGKQYGEGALIHYVEGLHYLLDTPEREWGMSKRAVLSDNRVLTVLLQNPDSIHNNLLMGNHWVDGVRRPVFMDWSASLHPGLNVTMTHYPYFRNDARVEHVRRQTLDYLRKLHWNDLQALKDVISQDEMRGILHRRDGIVGYFDRLIHERGWHNVVLEE
jgi:hypothetical protein